MNNNLEYKSVPLDFNRLAVIASASVSRKKNTIHAFTEVDITIPRQLINKHFEKTGEKLSFTAYIVTCLAQTIKLHPQLNSFIKRKKHILLDAVTISVLVEREIGDEKVPEPLGIMNSQHKTFQQIQEEIREASEKQDGRLGSLSDQAWIRFIPHFLLKIFIRLADKNIRMAYRYGKIAVTSVGMFSKEAVWFIPHGTATVLVTVGSIINRIIEIDGQFVSREHLCLTVSFDHDIVDGAPAARFMNHFTAVIKSGDVLNSDLKYQ